MLSINKSRVSISRGVREAGWVTVCVRVSAREGEWRVEKNVDGHGTDAMGESE